MARLTKKQQVRLHTIIADLIRGHSFIHNAGTRVCVLKSQQTTTLDYTRRIDDTVLYEIDKEIGSELCLLERGISSLKRFLDVESNPKLQEKETMPGQL